MTMTTQKHFMEQQTSEQKNKGFVTLIAVLVVSAIGSAVAISLILLGIGASRTSFSLEQSYQAKTLSDTCAELALQQVRTYSYYSGSSSASLGKGSCDYTVTNDGGNIRTITASGTVGNVTRRVKIIINKIDPLINTSFWQEVADF